MLANDRMPHFARDRNELQPVGDDVAVGARVGAGERGALARRLTVRVNRGSGPGALGGNRILPDSDGRYSATFHTNVSHGPARTMT